MYVSRQVWKRLEFPGRKAKSSSNSRTNLLPPLGLETLFLKMNASPQSCGGWVTLRPATPASRGWLPSTQPRRVLRPDRKDLRRDPGERGTGRGGRGRHARLAAVRNGLEPPEDAAACEAPALSAWSGASCCRGQLVLRFLPSALRPKPSGPFTL